MDLVADMLMEQFAEHHGDRFEVTMIRPGLSTRFRRGLGESGIGFSLDRLVTRFHGYPSLIRREQLRTRFDVFHIVDHTYGHLALELPADRTIITCHDIDAFRVICDPTVDRRGPVFRWMAARQLSGLRSVVHVLCDSDATRAEICEYGLAPEPRLVRVPLGVHPSCNASRNPAAVEELDVHLGFPIVGSTVLLHVGSTIPRKRIDTLLQVFARLRRDWSSVHLVQAGGALTASQVQMARDLGVLPHITQVPFLSRPVLAELYRGCALLLQPSSHEGFGLPVAEAMACGAVVVASDIPALREVGGSAASFCSVGDVDAWCNAVDSLLRERSQHESTFRVRKVHAERHAAGFSWPAASHRVARVYEAVYDERCQS